MFFQFLGNTLSPLQNGQYIQKDVPIYPDYILSRYIVQWTIYPDVPIKTSGNEIKKRNYKDVPKPIHVICLSNLNFSGDRCIYIENEGSVLSVLINDFPRSLV